MWMTLCLRRDLTTEKVMDPHTLAHVLAVDAKSLTERHLVEPNLCSARRASECGHDHMPARIVRGGVCVIMTVCAAVRMVHVAR